MVIAMDPELNPELILEGIARDLVRAIQDARKEADYNVEDRITINITPKASQKIVNIYQFRIKKKKILLSSIF